MFSEDGSNLMKGFSGGNLPALSLHDGARSPSALFSTTEGQGKAHCKTHHLKRIAEAYGRKAVYS